MNLFQRELNALDNKIKSKKSDMNILEDDKDKLKSERSKLILSIYDINDELTSKEIELNRLNNSQKIVAHYKKQLEVVKWGFSLLLVLNSILFIKDIIGVSALVLNALYAIIWINHGDYCNKKIVKNNVDETIFNKLNEEINRLETKKLMAKLDLEENDKKIIDVDKQLESLRNEVNSLNKTYAKVLNSYETSINNVDKTLSDEEVENYLNLNYKNFSKKILLEK